MFELTFCLLLNTWVTSWFRICVQWCVSFLSPHQAGMTDVPQEGCDTFGIWHQIARAPSAPWFWQLQTSHQGTNSPQGLYQSKQEDFPLRIAFWLSSIPFLFLFLYTSPFQILVFIVSNSPDTSVSRQWLAPPHKYILSPLCLQLLTLCCLTNMGLK